MKRPFEDRLQLATDRARRSVGRILDAATNIFGQSGFDGASMGQVAEAAGVSKGLLHYHFKSKEHLLIEAQRAVLRQIHRRFEERARHGDRGLQAALDGLDALWQAVMEMQSQAAFMVETMSISAHDGPARAPFLRFATEATELLESGIRTVFTPEEVARLAVPPERLAFLIRIGLSGLVVELAQARTSEDLSRVEQSYRDFRTLFERMVLQGSP